MFTHVAFERELFVTCKGGDYKNLYSLGYPTDGNPYLLEIRGKQAGTALEAKYNMLHLQEFEQQRLRKAGYDIDFDTNAIVLDRAERAELRRQEIKSPMQQYRIGGGIRLPRAGVVTAGLHVHFDNGFERSRCCSRVSRSIEASPVNIPRIVYVLDKAFWNEILKAGRQPGLYEMKPYGFEYRSLPTTVDIDRLVKVLNMIQYYHYINSSEGEGA